MNRPKIRQYDELMWPALQATKALGGSATVREINEWVVQIEGFSEEEQAVPHGTGRMSELEYRLHWARTHLKGIGALENPARGVWAVTDYGNALTEREMETETKKWREQLRSSRKPSQSRPETQSAPEATDGMPQGSRRVAGMSELPQGDTYERQDQPDTSELVAEDLALLDEPDPNPDPVSYSGSDFDVEGLVRRLNRGDILVPTFGHQDETIEAARFQRGFVWRRPQMDRFIESLLLGYPIPGIFLVQQVDKRYLVLDGQQRLRTLAAFYGGVHEGKEFVLHNVAERFAGLAYRTLPDELRRTLGNTFIQATIVKTDGTPKSLDSVYQIFERLNAGGTQLTPHEIRVALYAGPFVDFLTGLNKTPSWRSLYGPESPRIRDQELVLRFVALYVSPGNYKRPLKKYLNDFMAHHRFLGDLPSETIRDRFGTATRLVLEGSGPAGVRGRGRQVNAALTEAILVGLARRLDAGTPPQSRAVGRVLTQLLGDTQLEGATARATADEESVRTRLAITTKAFAQI